jgi:hypothetical protein
MSQDPAADCQSAYRPWRIATTRCGLPLCGADHRLMWSANPYSWRNTLISSAYSDLLRKIPRIGYSRRRVLFLRIDADDTCADP